jgi:catechol 2,3-dioxygenase-like lactoylglutathione lyase family enzyme
MKLNALDHVNIITDDLAATTRFFVDLFDLDVRDGPEPLPAQHVQWLYDESGRAIFHINPSRRSGLQRSSDIY